MTDWVRTGSTCCISTGWTWRCRSRTWPERSAPGTKRRPTLEENLATTELTPGPDELRRLDAALPPSVVVGSRYPESVMHMNGR
ncbi:hypothetical protein GCM10015535_10750 [Streptomyces gelaticus]|uniref:Uncharacterized protein n=1 Tax=Streptomyces gelaticus TaxID=285446 RepID=A0ABQ2VTN6_9ACTN|nr:hypothetical protein GCM10015535_10750 [Streptomyces gelaticus]